MKRITLGCFIRTSKAQSVRCCDLRDAAGAAPRGIPYSSAAAAAAEPGGQAAESREEADQQVWKSNGASAAAATARTGSAQLAVDGILILTTAT